jgi:hypothetical protein
MIRDQVILYKKFQFPEPSKPQMINEGLMAMRLNFLLEELIETANSAGFMFDETSCQFEPNNEEEVSAIGILDGLIDMTVVLLGTAYLMGFLREYEKKDNCYSQIKITFFEEAWRRVFEANLKKEVGVRTKRGHEMDLKKPEGWTPPNLSDLVEGFFGPCKDCGSDKQSYLSLKCKACEEL